MYYNIADLKHSKIIIEECTFFGLHVFEEHHLPSVKNIEEEAFNDCGALKDATFGNKLDRRAIEDWGRGIQYLQISGTNHLPIER